ncbi:MAG: hypothetical protein HC836_03645 [Richelia sp. RM2_1_2]|nr:hypothetical protein [Richelia sp. SM2_1_7]NJM17225.1 hypothetical protein [Richelia sp. SM1_7_0]NJN07255.1 hypothetical protein [Richelia sp. RM1_1_1]NJO27865.1 hypothetical protein [Richelia sp. SL_2_1]NJO57500.1 hypothetical protein [Richelia sp. RM2_1_2]
MNSQSTIFIKKSLSISGAIVLVIGAFLAIPKMADATGTLNHIVPRDSIRAVKSNFGGRKANHQDLFNGYQPPDFGRPASVYGTGTR